MILRIVIYDSSHKYKGSIYLQQRESYLCGDYYE